MVFFVLFEEMTDKVLEVLADPGLRSKELRQVWQRQLVLTNYSMLFPTVFRISCSEFGAIWLFLVNAAFRPGQFKAVCLLGVDVAAHSGQNPLPFRTEPLIPLRELFLAKGGCLNRDMLPAQGQHPSTDGDTKSGPPSSFGTSLQGKAHSRAPCVIS